MGALAFALIVGVLLLAVVAWIIFDLRDRSRLMDKFYDLGYEAGHTLGMLDERMAQRIRDGAK